MKLQTAITVCVSACVAVGLVAVGALVEHKHNGHRAPAPSATPYDLGDPYTRCVLALDAAEVDSTLCEPLLRPVG